MNTGINIVLNKKSILALSLLWTGSALLFIYIFFFTNNSNSLSYVQNTAGMQSGLMNNAEKVNANDAYVFVNVNKKYFLTKFVAIIPDEDMITADNPRQKTLKTTSVMKVNKIIKQKPQNKPSDFIIKPVTEL